MKRTIVSVLMMAALVSLGFRERASAGSKPVEVVVTNYTSAQPFSPPVCVVSDGTFAIYELGQAASAGLESIAEDAITSDLQALVDADESAKTLVMGDEVILPGHSDTIVVPMEKKDFVSCVWMLVRTNDTFASIPNVSRPKRRETVRHQSNALDAGTEVNDELKTNIPGFGDTDRKGQDEGGVVLGSTGIAGTGELDNTYDWRGHVAVVTVNRQ